MFSVPISTTHSGYNYYEVDNTEAMPIGLQIQQYWWKVGNTEYEFLLNETPVSIAEQL